MSGNKDTMASRVILGASVGQGVEFGANGEIHGHYKVRCTGPVEHLRGLFVKYRDNAEAARARGDAGLYQRYLRLMSSIPQEEKWDDTIENLVTTVGKNLTLDTILAGSSFTATVVMGLKGTGSAAAGDTQSSHAGWLEVGGTNAPAYTGDRKTPTFGSAAAGVKATSSDCSFAITSTGTVAGAFININGSATKDNTTGTLYSAGDFTGGNKSVINGDTLNVSYSSTLT